MAAHNFSLLGRPHNMYHLALLFNTVVMIVHVSYYSHTY